MRLLIFILIWVLRCHEGLACRRSESLLSLLVHLLLLLFHCEACISPWPRVAGTTHSDVRGPHLEAEGVKVYGKLERYDFDGSRSLQRLWCG